MGADRAQRAGLGHRGSEAHLLALAATAVALALCGAAGAETIQRGVVRISFDAGFAPRSGRVPVTIRLAAPSSPSPAPTSTSEGAATWTRR